MHFLANKQSDKINPEQVVRQFIRSYGLDPDFGVCYPQDYAPKCFKKQVLFKCFENIDKKITNKQITSVLYSMPSLELNLQSEEIDQFTKQRDALYLHQLAADLTHMFISEKRQQGLADQEIILPYNIAKPLIQVSNFLGVKYGMGAQFYANWKIKNKVELKPLTKIPQKMELNQAGRVYYYTESQKDRTDQDLFFGGSLVGSFYLFKSIQQLLQANLKILVSPNDSQKYCYDVLVRVQNNIKQINKSNMQILDELTPNFLATKLRKFFKGYKNINVQGLEQKMTSDGGAGGFDPCFQIFQRLMGIKFEGPLGNAQAVFRTGFPKSINNLIKQLQQNSAIKQYCDTDQKLKIQFNKVTKQYGNFFSLHREFLRKFVIQINPQAKTGMGGIKIEDIMERDKTINRQKIQ